MNKAFFDIVRGNSTLGSAKLTAVQVRCAEEIVAAGKRLGLPLRQVAYILATAWHEAKLTPVRENMNYTSASRIRAVWPSRFKSNAAAEPFVRNPQGLAVKVYGDRLGNRPGTLDGWVFRGGGLDQLTGRDNYTRIGIADHPERILEPAVAVASLVNGMTTGRYRGVKLGAFVDDAKADYANARAVVNTDVSRVGAQVAGYAKVFEAALRAGGYAATAPTRPVSKPTFNTGVKTALSLPPVSFATYAIIGVAAAAVAALVFFGG